MGSVWFALLFMPVLLMSSVGEASDLRSLVNQAGRNRLDLCRSLLLPGEEGAGEERQVRERLAFSLLTGRAGSFSDRGDRIVLRLVRGPQDPGFGLLSVPGRQDASRILDRELTPELILAERSESLTNEIKLRNSSELVARFREAAGLATQEGWREAVRLYEEEFPTALKRETSSRQQYALVLNRRGEVGDSAQAETVARALIEEGLDLPESYGILGRIYKDRWTKLKMTEGVSARVVERALSLAIETYLKGYQSDLNEYYPGVAAMDLLIAKGTQKSLDRAAETAQILSFSLAETIQNPQESQDFWRLATVLQVLVVKGDAVRAQNVLTAIRSRPTTAHGVGTTLESLVRMRLAWAGETKSDRRPQIDLADRMIRALKEWREELSRPVFSGRVAGLREQRRFVDTEGWLNDVEPDLQDAVRASGVLPYLKLRSRVNEEIIQDHLRRRAGRSDANGVILGLTGPYRRQIEALARVTHQRPWWAAYEDFGIALTEKNTGEFMETLVENQTPITFLVPRGFGRDFRHSRTWVEFEWLRRHEEQVAPGAVSFVYGAYELLNLNLTQKLAKRHTHGRSMNLMTYVLEAYQRFLVSKVNN